MRTVMVQSGWPYEYRAHVVETTSFGRPRWRFCGERKWVHWTPCKTSRRFKTRPEAEAAANRWLDRQEGRIDKDFV